MKESYLAVLSRYNHQEGYLDIVLKDLIESRKAVVGLDLSNKNLISILYDKNHNPYLLFLAEDIERVKIELKKRIIRAEGAIKFNTLRSLMDYLEKENIHERIQDEYSRELIYTTNFN